MLVTASTSEDAAVDSEDTPTTTDSTGLQVKVAQDLIQIRMATKFEGDDVRPLEQQDMSANASMLTNKAEGDLEESKMKEAKKRKSAVDSGKLVSNIWPFCPKPQQKEEMPFR